MTTNDKARHDACDPGETKGPTLPVSYMYEHMQLRHTLVVDADLYTQSQRELEQALINLASKTDRIVDMELVLEQVKRERDAINQRLYEEASYLGIANQERDRYRDCLSTLYARERPDSAVAQIIRAALNPPTPNPSDVQASESDDAVTREGG